MQNPISARNSNSLEKRCFLSKMKQSTVFKKKLYSMSGFDAKRIFQREMVKIWKNAFVNPK